MGDVFMRGPINHTVPLIFEYSQNVHKHVKGGANVEW